MGKDKPGGLEIFFIKGNSEPQGTPKFIEKKHPEQETETKCPLNSQGNQEYKEREQSSVIKASRIHNIMIIKYSSSSRTYEAIQVKTAQMRYSI